VIVDPPVSHRDRPIFLNILRVLDVPDALGLLSPRSLTIHTAQANAFDRTKEMYGIGGGTVNFAPP
jgi:hypothetical protein